MAQPDEASGPGLLLERDGPVLVATLNRPDALNAFDDDLHHAFARLWLDVSDDPDLRAVVLTGRGRAFSTGGSIDDFDRFRTDFAARRRSLRDGQRILEGMLATTIPVVAAVNGPAVGLGCTITTLCDVVFMAEGSYLADPHVSVALVAGDGAAVTWPSLTSLHRAKQYLLTGDHIPAEEAVALGFANFVVPPGQLLGDAVAFAQRIATQPPQAVQDTKAVLNQHLRQAAVTALGFGLAAESQSHDTAEYAAVPERFRSRRRP